MSFSTPRERKAKEGLKPEDLPGAGRWPNAEILAGKGSKLPAAHRRAALEVNCAGQSLRFSSGLWLGIGGRRCGEEIAFFIKLKQERHRANEKQRRAKNGGNYPGRWPDTEILAGKGNGHSPPTVALLGWSCARRGFHFSSRSWIEDRL